MCDARIDCCQDPGATVPRVKKGGGGDQRSYELVHVLTIGDVEFCGTGFIFPMPVDEGVESVLPAAHCDDFGAFLDKAVGHCGTDARCSTDHKDVFVLERHLSGRSSCI